MSIRLNHKTLSEKIKEQALKQEPLSEQLGITDRHLRNLCTKDTNISSALLFKLSEVLQVPMDELLTRQQEETE